ncbi:MAG: class I SAM-dependent methyltransferase [archaeon]
MQPQDISQYWNKVYDQFTQDRSVWREGATPFFIEKIPFLQYRGDSRILFGGCGDGRNMLPFATEGFECWGVDASQSGLERARTRLGMHESRLIHAHLDDTGISDESIDGIVCDFVMEHLEKPVPVIKEYHRMLKPGGLAMLEFKTHNDPQYGTGERINDDEWIQDEIYVRYHTLAQIKQLLRGFRILRVDNRQYTDPPHGPGYHRKERHTHDSYFVLAEKIEK